MVKAPAKIAAIPDAPEGRTYIVMGYGVWGRSPIAAKAWLNARRAGTAQDVKRCLVYEANDGSVLSDDGLCIVHPEKGKAPAASLLLRYEGR